MGGGRGAAHSPGQSPLCLGVGGVGRIADREGEGGALEVGLKESSNWGCRRHGLRRGGRGAGGPGGNRRCPVRRKELEELCRNPGRREELEVLHMCPGSMGELGELHMSPGWREELVELRKNPGCDESYKGDREDRGNMEVG